MADIGDLTNTRNASPRIEDLDPYAPGYQPPAPSGAPSIGDLDPYSPTYKPPRSAVGEVANQFKAGLTVDLPQAIGQGIQFVGHLAGAQPGGFVDRVGKSIADAAQARGQLPENQPEPSAHNAVTNAFAAGARNIPVSVIPPLAAGAAIAALPIELPAEAAIGGGLALGLLPDVASQGQQTYEKAKAAGLPEGQAVSTALKTAGIEGAGEVAQDLLGARALGLVGRGVARAFGRAAEPAAQAALQGATRPGTLKPFLKSFGEAAIGEPVTEFAQQAGEAAVEQQAGIPQDESPVRQGVEVVAPTLAMTTLLAPFGLVGHGLRARIAQRRAEQLASADTDPRERLKAASDIASDLHQADPQSAQNFIANATDAIARGNPLPIDATLLQPPAQRKAMLDAAAQAERQQRINAAATIAAEAAKPDAGPLTKAVASAPQATDLAEEFAQLQAQYEREAQARAEQDRQEQELSASLRALNEAMNTPTTRGIEVGEPPVEDVTLGEPETPPTTNGIEVRHETPQRITLETPPEPSPEEAARGIEVSEPEHIELATPETISNPKTGRPWNNALAAAKHLRQMRDPDQWEVTKVASRQWVLTPKERSDDERAVQGVATGSGERAGGELRGGVGDQRGNEQPGAPQPGREMDRNAPGTARGPVQAAPVAEGNAQPETALTAPTVAIDATRDVPTGAAISEDGKTAYIDRGIPRTYTDPITGKTLDVWEHLAQNHESPEKVLLDQGKDYRTQAHPAAQRAEHAALRAAGFDPQRFERWLKPYLKQAAEKTQPRLPLDIEPKQLEGNDLNPDGTPKEATHAISEQGTNESGVQRGAGAGNEKEGPAMGGGNAEHQEAARAQVATQEPQEPGHRPPVGPRVVKEGEPFDFETTYPPVPVDGGFALRRKPEGAEAPAPKAATTRPRREPKPLSAAEFADQYRRRLLNEIRRIGGIEQREMPDITGEGRRDKKTGRVHTKAGGWARLLFTKNGHSLDKIVEHMFSLGYFPDFESDNTDIKGYVDEAREIIRAAIDGDSVAALPPAAAQEYAQMAMQEEAEAEEAARKFDLPFAEANDINSVEDAIAVLGEDRVEQLARQYENEDDAKFLAVLREAVRDQRAHEEDHRGSEVPAQTSHGESGPPEFALEQHTEADLAAREERQRQAQLAEEERNRQEAQRAAADRERQNFALTGSDRPADIAMAGGQIDLLSAPQAPPGAQQRQPPESVRPENPFAEKAARARQEYERLTRPTAHDVGMANSFPLGAGFGREGGGKKIDAAIDRAVEAQRALRDAEHYEALAKAFDAGEIDAQGRSLLPEAVARRETRERHQESREERIAKAQEIVRGRPAWQVPRSVWADATGNLGGQARQLVEHDHREAVKAALARGESVPAEVLADYPDLSAAKPEAAQTGQKGRTRHEAKAALQDVEQAIRELRDGTATVDRYRQAFKTLADDPALIGDALNALTKNDLGKLIGFSRPDWGKEALVNQAYQSLLDGFALGKQYGPEFWSPFTESQAQFHARKLQALKELVASQTQADLDAYAQQIKKRRDEAERKTAAEREALSNPQSLEDFNRFMEFHVRQGKTKRQARLLLTPEQRARFDALLVDQSSGARERLSKLASGAAQKEPETGAAATPSQAVGAKIVETKHTQKGHDLFVVQLEQRVSREDFQKLTASAKQLGGYYSAFRGKGAVPGFQFRDRSQAEAFLKMASGFAPGAAEKAQETAAQGGDVLDRDSAQPTAERLEQMADTLEARAIEQLSAERKTNTARRAAIASRIEARARDDQAMARTMRNIAKAIRDGKATFLSGVRTKSQVQFLENAVRAAKQDELLDKYGDYPKAQAHADEPPDADTVEYAEFPTFTAYRSDLVKLARGMQQVAGLKLLGTRLAKVVDVVPEEYKRFVEEHLNELTLARSKDGMPAVLRTENDAQLAIDRAGLSDKAIVLSLGRGKHVVVLSPYEAQRSGLWSGGDQKVTLKRQFVTEVMNRLKGLDSEQKTVRIPWQFEVAEERLKTLERMGIKTPAQYRSALREYIALRKAPQEEDRVKKLEREMVGRRNDGLDFFPTPEKTADEMVTAADIRPGMTVLEPSAGMGHIAERIREAGVEPDVVELSSERRQLLEAKGFNVVGHDFMEMQPSDTPGGEGYDRIVMNPPFSDGRDIQHVRHAYELLKPGGRLVAILSEGTFFRNTQQAKDFRSWLESVGATDEKLAEGTFEDRSLPVNTSANARMVVIEKPERVDFQMGDAGTDEFSRTERAYGGREAYERARAEGRTKLNYRQWVQVRTPAFKRWFGDWETLRAQKRTVAVEDAQKQAPAEAGAATAGHVRESSASAEVDPLLTAVTEFVRQPLRRVNPDTVSKVVDPQTGEPMVVYHGTPSRSFHVFDLSKAGNTHSSSLLFGLKDRGFFGRGFYFSPDREEAGTYRRSSKGHIIDAFLNIKRPIDLSSPELPDGFRAALDSLRKENGLGQIPDERYAGLVERWRTGDGNNLNPQYGRGSILRELQDAFVRAGVDGAFGDGEIVAFRPEQIKSAIGNRGTFSPENPDIRFSRAAGEGQPAVRSTGFDKASGTVVADFKNDIPLKTNPDYKAAKAGDTYAAVRLVQALVKPESIEAAKAFGKDVTYVPVHAEEGVGLNKIPNALATYYAEQTGADVDDTLVQTNRAYHTGANAMERLLARAEFSGKVEPGRRYVLVDDVTTMGSTLADLAHYIRSQGGEVAGSVVLVNAMRGGKMTADAKTVRELEARHGDEIRKLFGIEPRALTGPEAQYLIGFRTTDELRNRVAKARQERIDRLHAKGVFPESQDSRGEVSRLLAANAQGQQSARTAPERPYGGLSVSEVQRIADRIAEKWQQAPPITVLSSMDDPKAPQAARDSYLAQQRSGATGVPLAFIHRNRVYLVADALRDEKAVIRAVAHEALGHYGLRGFFGKELSSVLDQLARVRAADVAQMAERYGFDINDPVDRLRAAEEVLASMAERQPHLGFVRLAIAAIRSFLRSLGLNLRYTDDEIIRDFILPARRFVERGGVARTNSKTTQFSLASNAGRPDYVDFSLSSPHAPEVLRELRAHIGDLFDSQRTFNGWWHKTVGTQFHKAKVDPYFRRVYEAGQNFLHNVSRLANTASDLAPELLPSLSSLGDVARNVVTAARPRDLDAVSVPIYTGTLEDNRVYSDAELKSRFKLNEKQIRYYRQFRAAVDKSLDDFALSQMARLARGWGVEDIVAKAMDGLPMERGASLIETALRERAKDQPDPKRAEVMNATADEIAAERDRVTKLKREGYAPLMRFGQYTVLVRNPHDPDTPLWFSMHDSQLDANRTARALSQDPEFAGLPIVRGVNNDESFLMYRGLSPEVLEQFAKATGLSDNALFQDYLRLAVSQRSAMKRLLRRKGVAGFDRDVTRSLASFITSNARAAAGNLHFAEMADARNAIPNQRGDVQKEADRLIRYLMNPQDEAPVARGFLFTNFIGGSVASAFVNLTQPILQTAPYLAQYGNPLKYLTQALRGALKPNAVQRPDLRAALDRAAKDGVIEPQQIHHLYGEAIGGLSKSLPPGLRHGIRAFASVWGSLFQVTEQFNRRVTFIAAYNMAKDMGAKKLAEAGYRDAFHFAEEAVDETQGVYNKGNRANWGRGAIGATLMTFKQFSVQYVEFLKRLYDRDKRAFAIAVATLIAAAGTGGLPFADDLDDLLDTIAQAFGYNWNTKKEMRDFAARVLGTGVGHFITDGVSGIPGMPIDIQQRLGFGNLIPGTSVFKRSELDKSRDFLEAVGPAGSLARNVMSAIGAVESGAPLGTVVGSVMPLAIQNAIKGYDMLASGFYRDVGGRRVVDTDGFDAFWKSLGFNPSIVAEAQEANRYNLQTRDLASAVSRSIYENLASAIVNGDTEARDRALQELRDWNARNPESKIMLNLAALRRRVQEMKMTQYQRTLRHTPKPLRPAMLAES